MLFYLLLRYDKTWYDKTHLIVLNINVSHNISMLYYHIDLYLLYYCHIGLPYLFQYIIISLGFAAGMAFHNSILLMYLTKYF